nr:hypothetical protein [Limnohabitans sp.]
MMKPAYCLGGVLCAVGCMGAWAQPAAATPPAAELEAVLPTTPMSGSLSQETWRLPANETMGMTGASLWWGASEDVKLGVASYGATRGQRGGFITLGVAGELQHRWSPKWRSTVGVFVGAGGGRGGQPLAGGGLMLRTDVGLGYDLASGGRVGAGVSHVRFPDGTISSTQPYVRYDHSFHSLWVGGRTPPDLRRAAAEPAGAASLALGSQEFALVARDVRVAAPAGASADTRMQLLGVEW